MKKVKFSGKLSLNKETVAKLNDEQMSKVKAGETGTSVAPYSGCGPCYSRTQCGVCYVEMTWNQGCPSLTYG